MQNPRFPYVVYSFSILLLSLTWVLSWGYDIPIRQLMSDPAQIHSSKFYTGFVSNLGVLGWGMGASAALFAAWLLRRIGADNEWIRFFTLGGILTVVLMLDDLFMFHEQIFPDYLFMPKMTGIRPNEKFIMAGYAAFTLWFLYSSRHTIKKTAWQHLMIACVILAIGIAADRGISKRLITDKAFRNFVEDGAKFLGILGWSLYFVGTAKSVVLHHWNTRRETIAGVAQVSSTETVG